MNISPRVAVGSTFHHPGVLGAEFQGNFRHLCGKMLQSLPVSGYLLGIELLEVLFSCPDVFSQRFLYPGKIKEVRQQVEEILPPERPYALRIRFGELALPGKILHGTVAYDRPGGEGRAQH